MEDERDSDPPETYPCEGCGKPVPAADAYADMETLTILCGPCLSSRLKPCKACGARTRAAAYQHLPSSRVVCEKCVLGEIAPPRKRDHTDYHVERDFVARALIEPYTAGGPPSPHPVPNVFPFAAELRHWMKQESFDLPPVELDLPGLNPYTANASVLVSMFRQTVNDLTPETPAGLSEEDSLDLEVRRTRLMSEYILLGTRICEVLVKQMLYCTSHRPSAYRSVALGKLLVRSCVDCPEAGRERHLVSLLGSLAHRYGFCGVMEQCLKTDLLKLKALRDQYVSHADTWPFRVPPTPSAAEARVRTFHADVGERLLHMFQHIAQLEKKMIAELRARCVEPVGRVQSNLISAFRSRPLLARLGRVLKLGARQRKATDKFQARQTTRATPGKRPAGEWVW